MDARETPNATEEWLTFLAEIRRVLVALAEAVDRETETLRQNPPREERGSCDTS